MSSGAYYDYQQPFSFQQRECPLIGYLNLFFHDASPVPVPADPEIDIQFPMELATPSGVEIILERPEPQTW